MTGRYTQTASPEWADGYESGYMYAMETIAGELAAKVSAAVSEAVSEWMKGRGRTE